MFIRENRNKTYYTMGHKPWANYQKQISGRTKQNEERCHQKKATTRSKTEENKGQEVRDQVGQN